MWQHIRQRKGVQWLLWLGLVVGLSGCAEGARAAARLHGYKVDRHGTICAPAQLVGDVCQPQRQGALK